MRERLKKEQAERDEAARKVKEMLTEMCRERSTPVDDGLPTVATDCDGMLSHLFPIIFPRW